MTAPSDTLRGGGPPPPGPTDPPDTGGSGPHPGPSWRPPEPPTRRRPIVTGSVLVAVGALWGLHVLGVDLRWELLLPGGLIVVGLGVLLGGRSEATRGLVAVGTVVAVLAVLVAVGPLDPDLDAGDRTLTVTTVDELEERYELGAGQLTLDLRDLELPRGTTRVEVQVGAGQLQVRTPADVTVVVDAEVGLGQVDAFGSRVEGITPSRRVTDPGAPGSGTLELDARVGLGQLEVTR